jgi:plasmid stability protein
MALPSGTLRDMVRIKANRHARSDEEAREFLEFTYKDNDLDMAVNFKDLSD